MSPRELVLVLGLVVLVFVFGLVLGLVVLGFVVVLVVGLVVVLVVVLVLGSRCVWIVWESSIAWAVA